MSVFCRWRTSRFAVNKSRKAVRYMRCTAQHACPRVARPSYLPIFRCYYIETRRKHTSHKTLQHSTTKLPMSCCRGAAAPSYPCHRCRPPSSAHSHTHSHMLSGTCARRCAALFTCVSRSTVPLPPRRCGWLPHTNCGHSGHLSSRHRLCSGHAHINEGSLVRLLADVLVFVNAPGVVPQAAVLVVVFHQAVLVAAVVVGLS